MNSAMTWHVQSGSIFRVPLSTLYLAQREGGLGLIDIKAKCFTLFHNRCIQLLQRDATLIAEWITLWNRTVAPGNPPNTRSIPTDLKYLWIFFDRFSTSLQLSLPPLGGPQTIRAFPTFWTRFSVDSNPCQISKSRGGSDLRKHLFHPYVWWEYVYIVQGHTPPYTHACTITQHELTENEGASPLQWYRHATPYTDDVHCHVRAMAMDKSQDCCCTNCGLQICPSTVASTLWCLNVAENISHDHMANRTLHVRTLLYGMEVLSPYTTAWTLSDVLTRNMKI